MDYVAFCTVVLRQIIDATDASPSFRADGVPRWNLGAIVFGEIAQNRLQFEKTERFTAMLNAVESLRRLDLLEPQRHKPASADTYHVTAQGRSLVRDMTPLWRGICSAEINGEHATLLRIVNALGSTARDNYGITSWVDGDQILAHEGWTGDRTLLAGVARELERAHFLLDHSSIGVLRYGPTYRGLVWETRCKLTADSGEIDALLDEGETPTCDFKRQLEVRTASQKAELVKDVIALANSRGSGGRYLLIGFNDAGEYYEPDEPIQRTERDRLLDALDRDRLQTIVSNHTTPAMRIKYTEVAYRLGRVGKLEVIRDPGDLPYAVSTSIGNTEKGQTRVETGQVFVRDGAVTRKAEAKEIETMRAIAEHAKRRREELN